MLILQSEEHFIRFGESEESIQSFENLQYPNPWAALKFFLLIWEIVI